MASSGLLDVKKPPDPAAPDVTAYLANGNEWPSNVNSVVDKELKDAKEDDHQDVTPKDVPAAPVPCVGKFVIKRTSKVNGEEKFTFRRKRRTKNGATAAIKKSASKTKKTTTTPSSTTRTRVVRRQRKKVKFMPETSTTIVPKSPDLETLSSGDNVPWSTIPLHVLLIIFKEIIRSEGIIPFWRCASQVCKLWKEMADHPSLWTHIDVSKPKVEMTVSQLITLSRNRFANARELNLASWGTVLKAPEIKAISETCPLLTSLTLSGCGRVSGSLLKSVVDKCPKLTSLDISRVQDHHSADNSVSCATIDYLASKLGSQLLHLNIGGNVVRGLRAIIAKISEGFPELREFDMSGVSGTTSDSSSIHVEKLQQGCTKLRVLRLANVSYFRLAVIPGTEQASAPGFPDLEELSIAQRLDPFEFGLKDSRSDDLDRILKSSRKLKLLDLRGCTQISSSSLVRTPAWDLEHLFLSGSTGTMNSGLELVMQKWAHSLVQVDLSWHNQSGESIDLAVKALAGLTPSESPLRTLDLCGSSVSFEPIKSVLCNCPKLEVLNLSSCRSLPRGIKRIYNAEDLVKLKTDVETLKIS